MSGRRNPFCPLWQKQSRALGAITIAMFLFAIFVNPLVLRIIGLSLNSQPISKSGLWFLFVLFFVLSLSIVAAKWWDGAANLFVAVLVSALIFFSIDIYLRVFPPIEVTGQHQAPHDFVSNSLGMRGPEPRLSAKQRILTLGE